MHATAIVASAALMATSALAQSVGSAVVVNACEYPVYLYNTPAADGGYEAIDQQLEANGGQYSQQFTELSNGCGWSLKLSPNTSLSNIMQYEYTYQGNDIIWFDLSDVNGNPWNSDWEVTADGNCDPKDQAYRYSTDDAYGMQACNSNSTITVTLCSGESQNNGAASSASVSVAAATSTEAPATTSVASTPSFVATGYTDIAVSVSTTPSSAPAASTPSSEVAVPTTSPTTFATLTTAVTTAQGGVTITQVDTAIVTDIVTATAWHHWQRHEHHRRHGNA